MTDAATLIAAARARLQGSPQERLGDWAAARKLLGFGRAPRIVPVGAAWHLGALLIADEQVFATGDILRARAEVRRGFTAQSQRERAEIAAAARRGGFDEGETVHLGWVEIDLEKLEATGDSGILTLRDAQPHIRWSTGGATRPLDDYLRDQLALRPD